MMAIHHLTLLDRTCTGFKSDVNKTVRYHGYEREAVTVVARSSITDISQQGPVIRLLDRGSLSLYHFD